MRSQGRSRSLEDDGLQTDVMRFLAIIAFCLIAVLALVNELPPPDSRNTPPAIQPSLQEHVPKQRLQAITDVPPPPRPQQTIVDVVPSPHPVEAAKPITVVQPPTKSPPPPLEADPNETPDEALRLRFASDGDLLAMIRTGRVRVYAFGRSPNGFTDFLALDRALRFHNTAPPDNLHEIDQVPTRIKAALPTTRSESAFGVRFDKGLRKKIADLAQSKRSGTLLIRRSGQIDHVEKS